MSEAEQQNILANNRHDVGYSKDSENQKAPDPTERKQTDGELLQGLMSTVLASKLVYGLVQTDKEGYLQAILQAVIEAMDQHGVTIDFPLFRKAALGLKELVYEGRV